MVKESRREFSTNDLVKMKTVLIGYWDKGRYVYISIKAHSTWMYPFTKAYSTFIFNIYSFKVCNIYQQSKALGRYFNKGHSKKSAPERSIKMKNTAPTVFLCAFHQVQNLIFYVLHSIYTFLHSDISQAIPISSDPFSPSTLFNWMLILSMKQASNF